MARETGLDTALSQLKKRRPVITGVGAVTPLAPDLDESVARIAQGLTAIAPVRRFGTRGGPSTLGAEVGDFDARPFFRIPKSIKLTDRRTRFAVAAASMALRDSGLTGNAFDGARAGVIIGSSGSDLQVEDLGGALGGCDPADLAAFGREMLAGLNPLWLLVNLPNMVSAHISIQFDLRGPNSTVMTDWIAGTQALAEAAMWIEMGEADLVVAGGADTGVLPFVFSNYEQADLFDATGNDAFVPGDGAAVFVVEEREHALRRGARIHAEIVSSAVAAPPSDSENSHESENSLVFSMTDALERAGWRADEVSVISPAWIPHQQYRDYERRAEETLFGNGARRVVASHRRALGFPLAAASTIDLALQLRSRDVDESEKMIVNSLGFLKQAASLCMVREGTA